MLSINNVGVNVMPKRNQLKKNFNAPKQQQQLNLNSPSLTFEGRFKKPDKFDPKKYIKQRKEALERNLEVMKKYQGGTAKTTSKTSK